MYHSSTKHFHIASHAIKNSVIKNSHKKGGKTNQLKKNKKSSTYFPLTLPVENI